MSEPIKVLDAAGVKVLFDLLSLQDYPNNDVLMAVINAIDETKADRADLDYYQSQVADLEAFVKPVGSAGVFTDGTALNKSVGELMANNQFIETEDVKYHKVSSLVPTMADLKKGFNFVISIKSDVQHDVAFDFERTYYGIEVLPQSMTGDNFYTNVISHPEGIIGIYLNQILIVPAAFEYNGIQFERGIYFAENKNAGTYITSFRINGFSFQEATQLRSAINLKLDKDKVFVGTREEYNAAYKEGLVPLGALVILTDEI